jgi:hypothetical protein
LAVGGRWMVPDGQPVGEASVAEITGVERHQRWPEASGDIGRCQTITLSA